MTDEQNQLIMSRFEKEGHSFLIRLWKENRDNPMQADVWRGWVQHVQSNQKRHFNSTDDIPHIINGYLGDEPFFDQVFESVEDEQR